MKSAAILATVATTTATLASAQLAHVPSRMRNTGGNAIQSEWGRQHQDQQDARSVRKIVRERLLEGSMRMSMAVEMEVSSMSMAAEVPEVESPENIISDSAVEVTSESAGEGEGVEEAESAEEEADTEVATRGASSAGVVAFSGLVSAAMFAAGAAALF